ncbi:MULTISPECIES: outer membrane lipoprotein-sorting protein [Psychrilyobacter]|uniref:Outer membrane lipoprotein-sorting protein n=1 Tax=Psychrilyobacter piezotolerans TaxID=2293438 RepID=A0ABX9KEY9_9FUSO|nr:MULTISPECIES: outer membrane lipoprotein-sorting protein [Psychrilyobacter]MCS5421292.1 outer membrane lipoprotein-sorting protein [Psychrilyobacter sp. S5]NDI78155.1 outer membrane lipoprotein-sorting protein [Psychrilyobacter piezotolerans]RDE60153.1 outer membrane lipoprotein-sorting protein [Psychrilyobacter sp. S5]REI40335.1 outer membrane lipoprotein-sorting protein [Psychrilyobacter piezotolerans]
MKKLFIFFLLSNLIFSMSSEEILTRLDYNMTPESVSYEGEMIIHREDKKYIKKFVMDAVGNEKSFIVFKYPARDRGTKYLRNGKNLWIYMPSTSRTVKISKHMLKESMMGSDISYDDQTDRNKYSTLYNSEITQETPTQYVLNLIRKEGEEAKYYRQILWINKNTLTIDKGEMYANSGKLLKEFIVDEIKKIGDRYYITIFRIDDKLKKNSYTELILTEIKLNPDLSESIFTLKNLERK